MAYIHCVTGGSGGGIPAQITTDMNAVLNKKFGTSGQSYPADEWADNVNLMGLLPEKTVSGAVASFPDGADDVPIKTATFDIDPTLDGVSEVNVVRTGKNLFTSVGSETDKFVNSSGEIQATSGWTASDYIEVPSNATLYFNPNTSSGGTAKHAFYDSTKTFISYIDSGAGSFTTPSNCKYMRFSYRSASTDIQLEVGSSATAYTAYTAPETRTIPLGQTVYGGSVTVDEDGNVSLDVGYNHGLLQANAPNFTESISTNFTTYYAKVSTIFTDISTDGYIDGVCDEFTFKKNVTSADVNICYIQNGYLNVRVPHGTYTDAADFKSWVQTNGLDLTYEIATPTTSTLTPITPITSALGVNNIWCDTGDVETLTYRASEVYPVALVPKMNSNSQSGYVASASSEYSSGYQAYMVFDRTTNTEWAPQDNQSPYWVQIELPTAQVATRFVITTRGGGYFARTVTVQGSNDGTNFTDLGSMSDMTTGDTVVVYNPTTTAYKYYRFAIDNYGLAMVNIEGF